MARIANFMLCDTINNLTLPNGETVSQLVAPRTVLRPMFIPSAFSFGLSIGLEDVDLKRNNDISFKLLSPTKDLVQESGSNELPPIVESDSLPKEFQGYTMNIDIRNLIIKEPGVYIFVLYVNGSEVGSINIPIYAVDSK